MSEREARQSSVRARINEFESRSPAGEPENAATEQTHQTVAGKRMYPHTKHVLVINRLCSNSKLSNIKYGIWLVSK